MSTSKKARYDKNGALLGAYDFAYCRHCNGTWNVWIEMTNPGRHIKGHIISGDHQMEALKNPKKITYYKGLLLEPPNEFQKKMLLSLLRDGLSPEFVSGHFFQDFLVPRFHQFGTIHGPDALRDKMKDAYKLDEVVMSSELKNMLYWFGIDETPDSMNRPLVHGIATYVRNLENLKAQPEIRHALVLSETHAGRCTAEVVVQQTRSSVEAIGSSVRQFIGLSSDSASYMGAVGDSLASESGSRVSFIQIHCPSHLIHNLMNEVVDWIETPLVPNSLPWMKSALNFMSDALTVSKLRELQNVFERVQKYSRIRWLTIGKCADSVYSQWEEFATLPAGYMYTAASLIPPSVNNLERGLLDDTLVKAKVHLLAILAEKWGPTLKWFESNNPRSFECLAKLREFDIIVNDWIDPVSLL